MLILWILAVLFAIGLTGWVFYELGWLIWGDTPLYDVPAPKDGRGVWVRLFNWVFVFGVWRM